MPHFGWRGACLIYAGIHLAILLPLYLFVLPSESPPTAPLSASPNSQSHAHTSLSPRGSIFLLVAATITLSSVISTTLSVHLLTVLQAKGLTLAAAVGLGALVGPSQVAARAVEMVIARYHHPIWTKVASTSLVATGLAALWLEAPIIPLALALYGAGIGLESIARGTLPLAVFGPERYPVIMGRIAMPSLIAQAAAPSIGAALIEARGVQRGDGGFRRLGSLQRALGRELVPVLAKAGGVDLDPSMAIRAVVFARHRPMGSQNIAPGAAMPATNLPSNPRAPAAFAGGAIIGALGGLIGLGGAEFRLPLLIGAFRFPALQAVILNKAMSLVVVASALPFRAAAVPFASVAAHWPVIVNLLAGSLLGAWFGAGWATKLASQTLYRVIAIMLLLIAVVLVLGHDRATSGPALVGAAQMVAGVVAGFVIGIVAALLGVAGGELLIPTLVLLFGADIKLAGSLSLAVSLPTMLVGFARYSRDRSFVVLGENRGFVLVMAIGSIVGSFVGGQLLGVVPTPILLPLLAVILVLSAFKSLAPQIAGQPAEAVAS